MNGSGDGSVIQADDGRRVGDRLTVVGVFTSREGKQADNDKQRHEGENREGG